MQKNVREGMLMKKIIVSFGIVLCAVLVGAVVDVLTGYSPEGNVAWSAKVIHVVTHIMGSCAVMIVVFRSWYDWSR
jgi:cytochrome c biogenesis protein CcdA